MTDEKTQKENMDVFIIGSKGIPANYGGFESFVENLTYYKKNEHIKYHVSCLCPKKEYSNENRIFEYNNARCFNVKVPSIGPAKAVYYDIVALKQCIAYIRQNRIENAIIYILACRIGPFIGHYEKQIKALGAHLYVNPDGHEWKRDKWNWAIKKYWKLSERLMVKHAELLICDSKNIEKYINEDYKKYNPDTTYISYGAEMTKSVLDNDDEELLTWYHEKGIKAKEYYLVVGRFVPENNYEIMIREFMKSNTKKFFVLITNVESNKFYKELMEKTGFDKDPRIKFVGTVYNQELLKKIRENAFGYFHGHEVGGTNPSLLEALASTDLNLLLDVSFNREVGDEAAVYWSKKSGNLAKVIEDTAMFSQSKTEEIGIKAKKRIQECYNWNYIVSEYEKLFTISKETI